MAFHWLTIDRSLSVYLHYFSAVRSGSLLLDSSTIEPATSQEMEKLAAEKGAIYMDAPVSGGKFGRCEPRTNTELM